MAITHSTIPVSEDTAGTLRNVETVTMAGGERRQAFAVGEPDSAGSEALARVKNSAPGASDYGLVVRPVTLEVVKNTDVVSTDYGLVVRPVGNGTDLGHRLLTNSNNALTVRAFPARLYGVHVWNDSASKFFVKIYNKATPPAPATDSGVLMFVFGVQAGTHRDITFAPNGAAFSTGIALAVVTGIADDDNTATLANAGTVDYESKLL